VIVFQLCCVAAHVDIMTAGTNCGGGGGISGGWVGVYQSYNFSNTPPPSVAAHLKLMVYGCLSSSSAVWLYTTSRMTWMPASWSLRSAAPAPAAQMAQCVSWLTLAAP
jgi:hypothetical protein